MRKFIIFLNLFLYRMDLQNNRKIETTKEKLPITGKKPLTQNLYIKDNLVFIHPILNRRD